MGGDVDPQTPPRAYHRLIHPMLVLVGLTPHNLNTLTLILTLIPYYYSYNSPYSSDYLLFNIRL